LSLFDIFIGFPAGWFYSIVYVLWFNVYLQPYDPSTNNDIHGLYHIDIFISCYNTKFFHFVYKALLYTQH